MCQLMESGGGKGYRGGFVTSVVDPNPDSKLLIGSGSGFGSGINHSGSGQLRIRNDVK